MFHPLARVVLIGVTALISLYLLLSASCTTPAGHREVRRPSREAIADWQSRKFGMFIHWGLYSIPAGVWNGERVTDIYSEQIMLRAPIPLNDYTPLAKQFNPDKWDPRAIAKLAKAAGMRFIVITSKHHDGFSLFHTKQSGYNAVDGTPYGRDIIKELADATRAEGLHFGVYFSSIDWHWGSVPDKRNNNPIPKELEELNVAQLKELTANYGPLSEIWFDMGDPTPEQSKRWADTVHAAQPDCMVSGRVFNHQGDFTVMGDNAIPSHIIDEPWQTPGSIYHETWGYRSWQDRGDLPGKVREHLLNLVKVVSRGGNYLLNIGPRGDGSVVEFEAAVLRSLGRWLALNGEAIYETDPQPFRDLDFGYVTRKPGRLYLLVTDWPEDGRLRLPAMRNHISKAYFLSDGWRNDLDVEAGDAEQVVLAQKPAVPEPVTVLVVEHEGELSLAAPMLTQKREGNLLLHRGEAREYFNYNGRSYYEPPSVYKLEWQFQVPEDGDYVVDAMLRSGAESQMIELEVAGIASRHEIPAGYSGGVPATWGLVTVRLRAREDYRLTLTPPIPFEKGTALGVEVQDLMLRAVTRAEP